MSQAIEISVTSKYLGIRQQSQDENVFVFSYTVNIHNVSEQALQLMSRYWLITNGDGEKVEVKGDGVVGEQPMIAPNETFSYTSASMLKTSVGTMEGFYYFSDNTHTEIKIPIPVFSLVVPNSLH
ncbi:Co2+/Mg2+ efflux protein ApaG [Glaciecola sp. 2405UD65-10]|uniref:Co2+/Mg2+ efflux protein ApaG n=1 Tax=Glaciecola sp. 2405UD65-10 TaxID=3397244 RepID=UPI003B5AB899